MGYKKLSDQQEKELVQEYINGASVSALMKRYGYKSKKSILDKVKKHLDNPDKAIEQARINRKGYNIDLSIINSEFKAYFIGLLMTDGYIVDNNKFGIDLVDKDCITFLSEAIGKNYNYYPQSNNRQDKYRLLLSDSEQVNALARYGIVKNKTLNLSPSKLKPEEKKYIPYIIRGIIDGDGSILQTNIGSPAFQIVSASEDFIKWCIYNMEEYMYMNDLHYVRSKENLYTLYSAKETN